jgi:hypothetical protein
MDLAVTGAELQRIILDLFNPDSAVAPCTARARSESEVAKTPKRAVSKPFAPLSQSIVQIL